MLPAPSSALALHHSNIPNNLPISRIQRNTIHLTQNVVVPQSRYSDTLYFCLVAFNDLNCLHLLGDLDLVRAHQQLLQAITPASIYTYSDRMCLLLRLIDIADLCLIVVVFAALCLVLLRDLPNSFESALLDAHVAKSKQLLLRMYV